MNTQLISIRPFVVLAAVVLLAGAAFGLRAAVRVAFGAAPAFAFAFILGRRDADALDRAFAPPARLPLLLVARAGFFRFFAEAMRTPRYRDRRRGVNQNARGERARRLE